VCWLAELSGPNPWAGFLDHLQTLGVQTIPSPVNPRMVIDGWCVLVESRTRWAYRSYLYSVPSGDAMDPAERAAAHIADVVHNAFP
jgi:hypothetical protein